MPRRARAGPAAARAAAGGARAASEASALDAPPGGGPRPAPPAPPHRGLDLEQRIGARWATWVGIVAILVGVALFLKWAFDTALLGPAARVALGLVAGLVMLGGGLLLHRRRDVPYLSEGLAGGGLGVLYLSLFAAHALYGLVGAAPAFVAMFAVTLLGTAVAVASSRLITAVLAVLGGLLTPVLLQVERPDERNLLAYLLVLDVLVLLVARFRTWPPLNRLAWVGSALLLLPTLLREPEAPRPLARLLLLSALFLIFLVVPLFRDHAVRRSRDRPPSRADRSGPGGRQRGGLLLGGLRHARGLAPRVGGSLRGRPGRALPPRVGGLRLPGPRRPRHRWTCTRASSWTFLTLAMPLALDGQWVTLAWAVQGVMLLWLASRSPAPVAAWGGPRGAAAGGRPRGRGSTPTGRPTSGRSGTGPSWSISWSCRPGRRGRAGRAGPGPGAGRLDARGCLRAALWVAAVVTLAVQFWREPSGHWPARPADRRARRRRILARVSSSPAFVVAIALLAGVVLARVLGADDDVARGAAGSLVSLPLLIRVAACVAVGLAGGPWPDLTARPRPPRSAGCSRGRRAWPSSSC